MFDNLPGVLDNDKLVIFNFNVSIKSIAVDLMIRQVIFIIFITFNNKLEYVFLKKIRGCDIFIKKKANNNVKMKIQK